MKIQILIVCALFCCLFAEATENREQLTLDITALDALAVKLNEGKTDFHKKDLSALSNIDLIYRKISTSVSIDVKMELLADIAKSIKNIKFKSPPAYLLRNELQLLAAYIVAKLNEENKEQCDWEKIKKYFDEISSNNLEKTKNIFYKFITLKRPEGQIKSIKELYLETGKELEKDQKIKSFGHLFFYFCLARTEDEKKLLETLKTDRKFKEASRFNLFSFSDVIKDKRTFIILRRYFLNRIAVSNTRLMIFNNLRAKNSIPPLSKNKIGSLSKKQMKWLLGEPQESSIGISELKLDIKDIIKKRSVSNGICKELYENYVSGFLK